MKVVLFAADAAGCAFVRCEEPLRVSGVEGEVRRDVPRRGIRERRGETILSERTVVDSLDADVVVFQRPPHRATLAFIEQFQSQGVAVVVDVDDDLRAIHPDNESWGLHHGRVSPDLDARFTAQCCQKADLVTVTTPALAERYGAHGRVAVLPNCVPAEILDYPRDSDGHTLGWSGRVGTHPGDLEVTHGGVGEALGDWRFQVIGEAKDVRANLHLPSEPYQTPWLHRVPNYHRALGKLDVGIIPLGDTAFNAGKSWLKGIEMAARGVPFVASPRAEYQRLGLGLLANDRARNWRSALRALLGDASLREELAEQGRETVREHHTYEGNSHLWPEAWERAIAYRHGRTARAA